jgi:hypothetical protein
MISDLPSYCRRVIVAAAVAGLGVAGSTHSALARVAPSPVVSPAAPSQSADGAIVVADNNDNNGDNGHKNGKGKKSGNNDHNGNWNKNGGKNWSNNNHWNNHWNDNWNGRAYVRGWQPRPYYGDFIGGVVLGSLLAAAGAGIVPYSPDPNLCWYWADPYMYRGYWDYCY